MRRCRSDPTQSIRCLSSSMFSEFVTSVTGWASSPFSIQNPDGPREMSPVTALMPKTIISVTYRPRFVEANGTRLRELPRGEVAMPAVAVEARVVRVALDALGERGNGVLVPPQVGLAAANPDEGLGRGGIGHRLRLLKVLLQLLAVGNRVGRVKRLAGERGRLRLAGLGLHAAERERYGKDREHESLHQRVSFCLLPSAFLPYDSTVSVGSPSRSGCVALCSLRGVVSTEVGGSIALADTTVDGFYQGNINVTADYQ